QRFDPFPFIRRRAGSHPRLALSLPQPTPQALGRAANLRGDRRNRRPLRGVVALVIPHHSNRPLANLSRKFVRRLLRVHSGVGAGIEFWLCFSLSRLFYLTRTETGMPRLVMRLRTLQPIF